MKRFAGIFLNVVTVLSLALFVVAVALWARSYGRCDYASRVTRTRYYVALTFPGGAKFMTFPRAGQSPEVNLVSYRYDAPGTGPRVVPADASWSRLGFDLRPLAFNGTPAPGPAAFELFVPFWFATAASLVPPAAALVVAARRRRRRRDGLCSRCRYDLTGNVSGACPECGAEVAKPV